MLIKQQQQQQLRARLNPSVCRETQGWNQHMHTHRHAHTLRKRHKTATRTESITGRTSAGTNSPRGPCFFQALSLFVSFPETLKATQSWQQVGANDTISLLSVQHKTWRLTSVESIRKVLKRNPDATFVLEEWPALFKLIQMHQISTLLSHEYINYRPFALNAFLKSVNIIIWLV